MRICREEIFGPVQCILKWSSVEVARVCSMSVFNVSKSASNQRVFPGRAESRQRAALRSLCEAWAPEAFVLQVSRPGSCPMMPT